MLKKKLSIEVKKIVLNSLTKRIIDPMRLQFLNDTKINGYHYWRKTDNNWNVVCWTSVAFVALVILKDQVERDYFLRQTFENTQLFLDNLRDDGYFSEGNKIFVFFLTFLVQFI
jgi:hypothetical protein